MNVRTRFFADALVHMFRTIMGETLDRLRLSDYTRARKRKQLDEGVGRYFRIVSGPNGRPYHGSAGQQRLLLAEDRTDLVKDHTVVVPDLRGIRRSSKPEGGYD
jgi:hypothetical protein